MRLNAIFGKKLHKNEGKSAEKETKEDKIQIKTVNLQQKLR